MDSPTVVVHRRGWSLVGVFKEQTRTPTHDIIGTDGLFRCEQVGGRTRMNLLVTVGKIYLLFGFRWCRAHADDADHATTVLLQFAILSMSPRR